MTQVNLKGKATRLSGEFPTVGSVAPDFKLTGGDLEDKRLSDFKGKRKLLSIVISFDTPVCSLSTKKFNDVGKANPKVALLVISADLPFAQKRICGAENITHVTHLSMMRDKEFAKAYGLLIADGPLAGLCARAIVVLDEQNRVVYTELVPEITQEPNYDKAVKALLQKS